MNSSSSVEMALSRDALLNCLNTSWENHQKKPLLFYKMAYENLNKEFEDLHLNKKTILEIIKTKILKKPASLDFKMLLENYVIQGKKEITQKLRSNVLCSKKDIKVFNEHLEGARQTLIEIIRHQKMLESLKQTVTQSPHKLFSFSNQVENLLAPLSKEYASISTLSFSSEAPYSLDCPKLPISQDIDLSLFFNSKEYF